MLRQDIEDILLELPQSLFVRQLAGMNKKPVGGITMTTRTTKLWALFLGLSGCALLLLVPKGAADSNVGPDQRSELDQQLEEVLASHGFTGRIGLTLEQRIGRHIDNQLADLGRLLFFDTILGLNNDNNCSGCHSPTNGFGDTQSIAIGINNNGIVGVDRAGPRNQRRAPTVANTAFYPTLMWNSRFASRSNNPFDNGAGFSFPSPEGLTLSYLPHLLDAQAFIPPTERVEAAGFSFPGDNYDIRNEVLRRINNVSEYRFRFGKIFPAVRDGGQITFDMLGKAIAEF